MAFADRVRKQISQGPTQTMGQSLLQGMKPSLDDTVDVARGKMSSLTLLNKMLQERSRETSKLMREYHIDKLQASEMADKKINGTKIRESIEDKLSPMITIELNGERKTLPRSEARRRGVPNV